ncbi:MAG: response regulator transcription factor [Candidatus Izimaplasma sp.]|nr:response regulator transcription factor [Candidatus Izimaplasma bacterium]
MANILIIEDEASIQRMIEYDLKQLDYTVELSSDGKDGYNKAKSDHYDVILLDLMLPSMNGLDICKKLRNRDVESYIIMLTALSDEYDIIKGFEAGADDYMTKPFSPRELTARIKAGLRRTQTFKKEDKISYQGLIIKPSSYEVFKNNEKIELTLKEFELLLYLVKNRGIALSRDQLLTNLWGFSYDGDSRIVDVHIFKLREKLDKDSTWLKTVRGIGYKIVKTD